LPVGSSETPVLDTLADMTADSISRCGLDADELILVRLAALAAVEAQPVSYLAHVGPSVEAGVTTERVEDVLMAIAPIIGTAHVMTAGINIAKALGVAVAVAAEEAAATD
jgi:alkylhydroperoxidase/carboxymuconolactone decarboxylase family protein YurZ